MTRPVRFAPPVTAVIQSEIRGLTQPVPGDPNVFLMNYTVIARRWRPKKFEDVVGQPHVVTTLKNSIRRGRIAHAYLFAGPRGVGKTSISRILAKAVNCVEGVKEEPCNVCQDVHRH